MPGVAAASVNLATERAQVRLETPSRPMRSPPPCAAGYDARPVASAQVDDAEQRERRQELRDLSRRLWVATALSVPVVLLGNLGMLPAVESRIPLELQNAIMLALATPWCNGGRVLAVRTRRVAQPDASRARHGPARRPRHAVGLWLLARRRRWPRTRSGAAGSTPHTYFDTAVVIITLILLGRWLEARARGGHVCRPMRRLLDLQASHVAHRAARAIASSTSPLDEVRPGRRADRATGREGAGRRRRARRPFERRPLAAHRRVDAGRGRTRRRRRRRHGQPGWRVPHARRAGRRRLDADADRAARRSGRRAARPRSRGSPTAWRRCSCRW